MKTVYLGWQPMAFQNYVAAFQALGVEIDRSSPEHCDALLLPGGADIHPGLYSQSINGSIEIDEARDAEELALFRSFLAAKRPILGICRGMQLINAALGGTLHQHIEGHSRVDGVDRIHAVIAADDSMRLLYGDEFLVNSAHHQSVDRLAQGLRVTARAGDGTVEAFRHESLPILAVQWHPERLCGERQKGVSDGAVLLRWFLDTL